MVPQLTTRRSCSREQGFGCWAWGLLLSKQCGEMKASKGRFFSPPIIPTGLHSVMDACVYNLDGFLGWMVHPLMCIVCMSARKCSHVHLRKRMAVPPAWSQSCPHTFPMLAFVTAFLAFVLLTLTKKDSQHVSTVFPFLVLCLGQFFFCEEAISTLFFGPLSFLFLLLWNKCIGCCLAGGAFLFYSQVQLGRFPSFSKHIFFIHFLSTSLFPLLWK